MEQPDFRYWKPVDFVHAKRALSKRGRVFPLPACLSYGNKNYRFGLETCSGTCFLISDQVAQKLSLGGHLTAK